MVRINPNPKLEIRNKSEFLKTEYSKLGTLTQRRKGPQSLAEMLEG